MSVEQTSMNQLITDNIDIWTSTVKTKSASGRGSSKKRELYGVKKLRELILELAVRGKLVPQDSNDEPASVLLERIAEEKAQLVKEKKIRKPKPLSSIQEKEKTFDIPTGWSWTRIGLVTTFVNGFAFKSSSFQDSGVGIVKIGDISFTGELTPQTMSRVDQSVVKDLDASLRVNLGDMVIAMSGATTGKVGFSTTDEVFYLNQRVGKFIPHQIDLDYLFFPLTTKIAENLEKSLGSAIPNLSTVQINEIVVALPPLQEQKRIAAKVDELMALCDQLEQQTEVIIEAHQVLVTTLLDTLINSADADELMQNWARISEHFDTLFTTEESIDQLKQTILQLAVMGKLVPQDPTDEPAAKLLERIAEEKAQLIKEKKIKKQKALPPITDDEKPFELPNGWEWCRTGEAGNIQLGRQRSPKDHSGPHMIPYLRVANVHDNRIDTSDVKEMNFTPEEQTVYRLVYGDILLNEGQSKELVGRPAMFKNEVVNACFQNTLLRFKAHNNISSEYSLLYFRHCLYSGRFQKAVKQTTNMAHLSAARLIPIEFPLPPAEEQIKIVERVNQLSDMCDQLKQCLRDSQQTKFQLTDAIVEQAV
ncbi:type I restriction enzyme S subunit [Vibrio crassostreae]|uniref:restriction endonuclease subunit S n=1 Tax=Vibrio crassostreae TaxID=246167 RepID=UPI000F4706F9|nr:restriction endonuclease subunit S [Vibrio crassostreae]ROR86959.1 type I restriction enzyme S subunit [Vibrio crassostreae]